MEPLVNVLIYCGEMITIDEAYLQDMGIYTMFGQADCYEHQRWKFNPGYADLQEGWSVAWRELMDYIDDKFPRLPISLSPQYHKPLSYVAAACATCRLDQQKIKAYFDRINKTTFDLFPPMTAISPLSSGRIVSIHWLTIVWVNRSKRAVKKEELSQAEPPLQTFRQLYNSVRGTSRAI